MRTGFRHIAHSFICLLLGWQLLNISVGTSRFLSYVFQVYQQTHPSSDDQPVSEEADPFMEIDWETDCADTENDESKSSQEENEPLDFFYTHPDAFALCYVLRVGKGVLNHSFEANLESITLDITFPPPEV